MPLKQINLQIEKQTDEKLLSAVQNFANEEELQLEKTDIRYSFSDDMASFPGVPPSEEVTLQEVISQGGELITAISIYFPGGRAIHVTRKEQSWFDQAAVHPGKDQSQKSFIKLVTLAQKHLAALEPQQFLLRSLSEGHANLDTAREQFLARQEKMISDLIERTASLNAQLAEEISKQLLAKSNELDDEFKKRRDALEEDFRAKHEELTRERERLDQKVAQLDDRDSKHVRREIRLGMLDELKAWSDKFELTKGTQGLRRPVTWLTAGLITLFGIGIVTVFWQGQTIMASTSGIATPLLVWFVAKQLVLSAAFGMAIVFFIRWNRSWFEQHANEEFRHKRFHLDIERASWLVETALDWSREKGEEIPSELLSQLSKGIFEDAPQHPGAHHPAEQLGALLGAAAHLKLKTALGELDIDKKGLRTLAKETSDS